MCNLIFVYGTLKEGFCNFAANTGVRLPGEFETVDRYPLYVVGPHHLPWLVNTRGKGHKVIGQLFELGAEALAEMDDFEETDKPYWYTRAEIRVCERGSLAPVEITAQAYFGHGARLNTETVYLGPLAEYTLLHDAGCVEQEMNRV
jgi:gamma-glutamylaminecyclotransferase